MENKKVRIGIIGMGIWGQKHVAAYKQHSSAEIVAVCDIKENHAKEISSKHNIPSYYSNVDRMLENEYLDAVSVATPDDLHADPVIKAAQKGLHIMVEKPLAMKVNE